MAKTRGCRSRHQTSLIGSAQRRLHRHRGEEDAAYKEVGEGRGWTCDDIILGIGRYMEEATGGTVDVLLLGCVGGETLI